ncbi:MAG: hypothetical protein ED559_02255 [Phycisphaera sp.]|nr:MAG: hypothetical protein ED559_02255 [Phycisphaera sp.]
MSKLRRLCLLLIVAGLCTGCYSKVVDSKGIGADSEKLKKSHEYGSETPVRDLLLREQGRNER